MKDNKVVILLVEDDFLLAMTEQKALEAKGYLIYHVIDGEKAVQSIIDQVIPVDLILMDIDLGNGIDGTQAAEQILKIREIPIVFLSSHTEPDIVDKTEKITSYGYVVKNTEITVLDASIKMAMKLFNAKMVCNQIESSLRESENNYRELFENINNGVAVYEVIEGGKDFIFKNYNSAAEKLDNDRRDRLIGKSILEVRPGIEQFGLLDVFRRVWKSGKAEHYPVTMYQDERLTGWYDNYVYKLSSGEIVAVFENVTERKQLERDLVNLNERLQLSYEAATIGSWDWDIMIDRIEWSSKMFDLLGLDMNENTASFESWRSAVHPDDLKSAESNIMEVLKNGNVLHNEYRIILPNGEIRWIYSVGRGYYDEKNVPKRMIGICIDITDRKQIEEKMKSQFREKEILLQEIHHRVKNNIANIENILFLQAKSNSNLEVQTALQDAVSRVQSMRILYERLLLGNEYQEVSMKHYIENLVDAIQTVFLERGDIIIRKRISDFSLSQKQAISVGIIINELITNIYKYAFKDQTGGNASISLIKEESGITLTVCDNGIGMDKRTILNESQGFGLEIIKMLTKQLNAIFSVSNNNGTVVVIQFKI